VPAWLARVGLRNVEILYQIVLRSTWKIVVTEGGEHALVRR
jgi:hypothetical protein